MELFKYTGRPGAILQGSYCYWVVLSFLAGLACLNFAVPITDAGGSNSTSQHEGSGHGLLQDFLSITDDEEDGLGRGITDEYINGLEDFDVGLGTDVGRGGGFIITDNALEDSTIAFDSLEVMCFRCHGNGVNGCDVKAMLQDAQTFSVTCFGKCLNLSSGSTAVYDCAHDMVTKTDTCLRNGDTEMCFCTGDFCNGPPEVDDLNGSHKSQFFFNKHSIPLVTFDDVDRSFLHHDDTEYETTAAGTLIHSLPNGADNKSTNGGFDRKIYKNLSGFSESKDKTKLKTVQHQKLSPETSTHLQKHRQTNRNIDKLTETATHLQKHRQTNRNIDKLTETATHLQKHLNPHFPHTVKTEVDVSISDTVSGRFSVLASKESTPNSVHVNELRVGNYIDRGKVKSGVSDGVSTSVLTSVCSVLIALHVL